MVGAAQITRDAVATVLRELIFRETRQVGNIVSVEDGLLAPWTFPAPFDQGLQVNQCLVVHDHLVGDERQPEATCTV